MTSCPPTYILFPYTTLFRSLGTIDRVLAVRAVPQRDLEMLRHIRGARDFVGRRRVRQQPPIGVKHQLFGREPAQDRKSTRLNSSHANIYYAVFGLTKKRVE